MGFVAAFKEVIAPLVYVFWFGNLGLLYSFIGESLGGRQVFFDHVTCWVFWFVTEHCAAHLLGVRDLDACLDYLVNFVVELSSFLIALDRELALGVRLSGGICQMQRYSYFLLGGQSWDHLNFFSIEDSGWLAGGDNFSYCVAALAGALITDVSLPAASDIGVAFMEPEFSDVFTASTNSLFFIHPANVGSSLQFIFSRAETPLLTPDSFGLGSSLLGWFPERDELGRLGNAGSFAGVISPVAGLSLLEPQLPSLGSFFLKLEALQDWRFLKLEREVWRTIDMLTLARQSSFYRKKFYSNFYDPASLASKVSI
jgi:hypothetical protein